MIMKSLRIVVIASVLGSAMLIAQSAAQNNVLPAKSVESPEMAALKKDPAFVIGPGDVLIVSVWHEPDVSGTIPVRPDGKISLPLLADVQAAGLTPTKLSDDIRDKLTKFIMNPQVTVVVSVINSQRYFIVGEVSH